MPVATPVVLTTVATVGAVLVQVTVPHPMLSTLPNASSQVAVKVCVTVTAIEAVSRATTRWVAALATNVTVLMLPLSPTWVATENVAVVEAVVGLRIEGPAAVMVLATIATLTTPVPAGLRDAPFKVKVMAVPLMDAAVGAVAVPPTCAIVKLAAVSGLVLLNVVPVGRVRVIVVPLSRGEIGVNVPSMLAAGTYVPTLDPLGVYASVVREAANAAGAAAVATREASRAADAPRLTARLMRLKVSNLLEELQLTEPRLGLPGSLERPAESVRRLGSLAPPLPNQDVTGSPRRLVPR